MIPAFSRSNNIGDLPAVLVNKIFASTWWQEVLHWFGHFRQRLYYREAMNPGNPRTMIFTHMEADPGDGYPIQSFRSERELVDPVARRLWGE